MQRMATLCDGGTCDTSRHNELVINFPRFVRALPASVEAIFIRPATPPEQLERAWRVQNAFAREFGLDAEQAPPLLLYDPDGHPDAPFRSLSAPPRAPPPSPYPHHLDAQVVAEECNSRWLSGRPSNDTREAGVSIHMFDDYERASCLSPGRALCL